MQEPGFMLGVMFGVMGLYMALLSGGWPLCVVARSGATSPYADLPEGARLHKHKQRHLTLLWPFFICSGGILVQVIHCNSSNYFFRYFPNVTWYEFTHAPIFWRCSEAKKNYHIRF